MLTIAIATAGLLLPGADWPQLRGPGGRGLASDRDLPVEFSPTRNIAWRTEVPPGKSSPVVIGSRLCLTGGANPSLETFCLDRVSGRILWRNTVTWTAPRIATN